jgi:hypothetical protein
MLVLFTFTLCFILNGFFVLHFNAANMFVIMHWQLSHHQNLVLANYV